MITPTPDIVEQVIDAMTFQGNVKLYTDNGDGTFTLKVDNIFYIRTGTVITIDSVEYTVTTVLTNCTFKITAGAEPTATTFTVTPPFYFHGTPYMTNASISNIDDSANKFPMIYLYEIINEDWNDEPDAAIERESDIRLFFLDEADFANWDTDDHYADAINPMRNLADEFIKQLKVNKLIGQFLSYRITSHSNFGTFVTDQGHTQGIFNDHTSGVELRLDLPVRVVVSCIDEC